MKMRVAISLILAVLPVEARATNPQSELSAGLLAQGVLIPAKKAPPGSFIEGSEESGTQAAELLWRGKPVRKILWMRPTAKLHLNLSGRTSFVAVGGEWRQHLLRRRLYVQAGFGLAVHDGNRFTPDPFVPGLTQAEAAARYELYRYRTAFGSRILFNPSLSAGLRLSSKMAMEGVLEHYSHKQVFNRQNPGINLVGVRLVRTVGASR
jgi:hypothetical protein